MLNLWYKNAVIYCVDVETFQDSDGDGIGDFRGLISRLDHIEALGATCIWLLPFYPSPNRDNGYDVADYYGVDPRYGTLGDFVEFTHAAHERGLRVLVDLVVNHSSIDHPWFQASRQRDPAFEDWYVWRKEKPADAEEGVIFPGVQESTWTYDRTRREYYFHRFYKHQADLNIANPAVREEIERIIGFWLALGVSGFRMDAVPFMLEELSTAHSGWEPHRYLSELQTFASWRRAEAILLAEANIEMREADDYFGTGDRLHVIFNFPLNQKLFLGLARKDASPVVDFLKALPDIPAVAQWATFLRNHDEIDLGRLEEGEREEVFAAFGPDKGMQLYERGLRRRLAPMLGGDAKRLAMAFSIMLALPGTPVIWYGDEIGMGEDLALPERHAVRTPMQWDATPNGGFSSAERGACVRPPVTGDPLGFERTNAEAQRLDPASPLSTVRRLIRARREAVEIGWGEAEPLDLGTTAVLGLRSRWRGGEIVTLHNLSDAPARIRWPKGVARTKLHPLIEEGAALLEDKSPELGPYGFAWFRVKT
ncbi:alpha-amylase family protein [Aureimonas sp. AU4]|uniref:alpha-amylase family protein n=1 Tax=Aureimonas sp. AU4 TaxID=1638163 RepID=UPI00078480DB|nr:alpha-amylase family protein [Aureimonas sp. AU4]